MNGKRMQTYINDTFEYEHQWVISKSEEIGVAANLGFNMSNISDFIIHKFLFSYIILYFLGMLHTKPKHLPRDAR